MFNTLIIFNRIMQHGISNVNIPNGLFIIPFCATSFIHVTWVLDCTGAAGMLFVLLLLTSFFFLGRVANEGILEESPLSVTLVILESSKLIFFCRTGVTGDCTLLIVQKTKQRFYWVNYELHEKFFGKYVGHMFVISCPPLSIWKTTSNIWAVVLLCTKPASNIVAQ